MNVRPHVPTALVAALAGIASGIILNSCSTDQRGLSIIKAQRIELVDQDGRARVVLSTNSNGAAGLSFLDSSSGQPRILIGTSPDGTSDIELHDAAGNRRAELSLTRGAVRLALVDVALKGGVILGSSTDRTALVFTDKNLNRRVAFGLAPNNQPNLSMYDDKNHTIWSTPAKDDH